MLGWLSFILILTCAAHLVFERSYFETYSQAYNAEFPYPRAYPVATLFFTRNHALRREMFRLSPGLVISTWILEIQVIAALVFLFFVYVS